MIRFMTLLAVLLPAVPLNAAAQAVPRQNSTALGAVESQYVRIADGVFLDARLAPSGKPVEIWSDVRLRASGKKPSRNEMAKNPEAMTVVRGDVVEVAIAVLPENATGPLSETTRITQRLATAGSTMARRFEQALRPAVTLAKRFDDGAHAQFDTERQSGF